MARAIDADAFRNEINEYIYPIIGNNLISGADVFYSVLHLLEEAPTIDPVKQGYVPIEVVKQIQWERDIAIEQLNSYGIQLGEKAELEIVKHGKWVEKHGTWYCSECDKTGYKGYIPAKPSDYCPNCGARMDGE